MINNSQPILTVFLAEDNQADVYLIRIALEESGIRFKLHTVSDGEEAIKTIGLLSSKNDCPALALIDQNLPRLSGDHVVRTLRSHPDCAHIPIIVMSSAETQRDRALVEQHNATFFKKPTNLPDFLELGQVVYSLLSSAQRGLDSIEP